MIDAIVRAGTFYHRLFSKEPVRGFIVGAVPFALGVPHLNHHHTNHSFLLFVVLFMNLMMVALSGTLCILSYFFLVFGDYFQD